VTNNYALLIENKGSGMPLIQELKRDNIHAIALEPKDDKLMRMNGQTARNCRFRKPHPVDSRSAANRNMIVE
jgi:hypothetical protein